MVWQVGRWWISVGTKSWHNYVSVGGAVGFLNFVVRHFQFTSAFNWKPHWPHVYSWPIFRRSFAPENKRWTAVEIGILFWPVAFGIHWHATCYGCVAEYRRDYDAYYEHRRRTNAPQV